MGAAPLGLRGARPRQKGAATARLPGGLRPARRCSGGVEAEPPSAAAWLRLRLTPAHCAGMASASARRWWRWPFGLSAGRAPAINGLARLRCACAPGGRSGRSPQADGSRRGVDARNEPRARALRLDGRARPGAPWLTSLAALRPSLLAFLPLRLLRRFLPLPQSVRSRGAVKGKMHGFAALDRSSSAEKGQARGGRRGCSSLGMHLADALLHPGGKLVRLLVFPLGVHLFAYLAGLWPSCGTCCGFRPGLACG